METTTLLFALSAAVLVGVGLGARMRDNDADNGQADIAKVAYVRGFEEGIRSAAQRERAAVARAYQAAIVIVQQIGDRMLAAEFEHRLSQIKERTMH